MTAVRYRARPREVLALRWVGQSVAEVVAALELPDRTPALEGRAGIEVLVVYPDGDPQGVSQGAYPGDYVAKDAQGRLCVMPAFVFEPLYVPVEDAPPA